MTTMHWTLSSVKIQTNDGNILAQMETNLGFNEKVLRFDKITQTNKQTNKGGRDLAIFSLVSLHRYCVID